MSALFILLSNSNCIHYMSVSSVILEVRLVTCLDESNEVNSLIINLVISENNLRKAPSNQLSTEE